MQTRTRRSAPSPVWQIQPVGNRNLYILQLCLMSRTITIRLTEELADWLAERVRKTGEPAGRIVRHQLEKARAEGGSQQFLRHAGKINGPADLSKRMGFARQ